jgi:hypothetical protein
VPVAADEQAPVTGERQRGPAPCSTDRRCTALGSGFAHVRGLAEHAIDGLREEGLRSQGTGCAASVLQKVGVLPQSGES